MTDDRTRDSAVVSLATVDVPDEVSDADWAVLDEAERHHVERMRVPAQRVRSAATRAALRRLVARRTGSDPAAVPISRGQYGQPTASGLYLSAAHSGRVGIVALCEHVPVGVDVECVDQHTHEPASHMLDRLAPNERRLLDELDGEERRLTFLRIWTAKEAVLKAIGCGLTVPLDAVAVDPNPLRIHARELDTRWWAAKAVDPRPGAIATVAAASRWLQVNRMRV